MSKPRTANRKDHKSQAVPNLAEGWKTESEHWAAWARTPGHDSYWRSHREQFFPFIPSPGALTVDIGCGEGRVSRDLKSAGHTVIGVDISEKLIELARAADPTGQYIVADAAAIPLLDHSADLAIAFMSAQDIDDLDGAILEIARILKNGGRVCLAIVHPINSAGTFESEEENSKFVIANSYLAAKQYSDTFLRDGLEMTFHSKHRPLDHYSRALEKAGLLIEAIREHGVNDKADDTPRTRRWVRIPLFMHIRAVKLGCP
jgi:ubiquinone/menaquinone biosynthesis C-methylase UbiE